MFKINKCFDLASRNLPKITGVRFSCADKCPPRYECKQPKPSDFDIEDARIMESLKPPVFVKKCHRDPRIFRNIFFFICVPAIVCLYVNMFYFTEEEFKRPKFKKIPYLRIRNKPFPWHPTRTLFHNPKRNALPDGYEEEVPEEQEYDPFD